MLVLWAHSYTLQLLFKLIIILYTAVVDCGVLTDPTNGMVDTPTTTFGSMATYSCNPGYQMTGLMMRTCTASGWSTGDDPVCTGEGDVLLNWCQVCTPQLSVLSSSPWLMEWSATVQTPPPFFREPWLHTAVMKGILVEVLGPVSLTEHGVDHPSLVHVCILKLTTLWVTNCVYSVICPDLPVPTNGAPLVYSDTTIPRAMDSTATYRCITGYDFSGTLTRMCTTSGWSALGGSTPTCTG